jgi:hypothetical protein
MAYRKNTITTAGGTFTGDIIVPAEVYGVGWNGSNEAPTKNDVYDEIETKQDTLVSATNIKTINGSSLLGSGDLAISSSDPAYLFGTFTVATGTGKVLIKTLELTTTQRATIAGTGRLRII